MKYLSFLLILFGFLPVLTQQKTSQFADFKTAVYKDKLHFPKWAKYDPKEKSWRDELGKTFGEGILTINFAGKYFITIHSCGTGCSYYTLTDLSSGKELNNLDIFANGEQLSKTSDGFEYRNILHYRQNSKLLIAQFLLEKNGIEKDCRERSFIFKNNRLMPFDKLKILPLTKNSVKCRKF